MSAMSDCLRPLRDRMNSRTPAAELLTDSESAAAKRSHSRTSCAVRRLSRRLRRRSRSWEIPTTETLPATLSSKSPFCAMMNIGLSGEAGFGPALVSILGCSLLWAAAEYPATGQASDSLLARALGCPSNEHAGMRTRPDCDQQRVSMHMGERRAAWLMLRGWMAQCARLAPCGRAISTNLKRSDRRAGARCSCAPARRRCDAHCGLSHTNI